MLVSTEPVKPVGGSLKLPLELASDTRELGVPALPYGSLPLNHTDTGIPPSGQSISETSWLLFTVAVPVKYFNDGVSDGHEIAVS